MSFTNWRTSSRSDDQGQCVEVAVTPNRVGIRDTKNRNAGHLTVTAAQWSAFIAHVKADQRDLPA